MAIEIKFDDNELNSAIAAHLKAKIPTVDESTVAINIVAARQPNGPYAEVTFDFMGSDTKVVASKPVNRAPLKKEVVKEEPVSTVTEEDTVPFKEDEIETSEEEDAADDAAAEELAEETTAVKKRLFTGKK